MTPHLHPRSRMTSSLFATTLAASFLVVGLPHLLPCPAPRVSYADSAASCEVSADGTTRRRRQRRQPRPRSPEQQAAEVKDGIVQFGGGEGLESLPDNNNSNSKSSSSSSGEGSETTGTGGRRRERECPVPKPGGVIGQLMGFGSNKDSDDGGGGGGSGGGKKPSIAPRIDGVDGKEGT